MLDVSFSLSEVHEILQYQEQIRICDKFLAECEEILNSKFLKRGEIIVRTLDLLNIAIQPLSISQIVQKVATPEERPYARKVIYDLFKNPPQSIEVVKEKVPHVKRGKTPQKYYDIAKSSSKKNPLLIKIRFFPVLWLYGSLDKLYSRYVRICYNMLWKEELISKTLNIISETLDKIYAEKYGKEFRGKFDKLEEEYTELYTLFKYMHDVCTNPFLKNFELEIRSAGMVNIKKTADNFSSLLKAIAVNKQQLFYDLCKDEIHLPKLFKFIFLK